MDIKFIDIMLEKNTTDCTILVFIVSNTVSGLTDTSAFWIMKKSKIKSKFQYFIK